MWEEKRLGEYVKINPESITSKVDIDEINYIDISSVASGVLSGYQALIMSEAPSRARRKIKNDDFIFSTVRPNLRAFYYVKNAPINSIASTGFAVIRAKKNCISRFMYYFITGNSFVEYLTNVAKGTTYPAVDTKDFLRAKISIPPLQTQQKIADILCTYDDLIENNNRRIELLEQAAQQMYKEWFVRFRFPGYEIAHFTKGIPDGWKVVKLGDVVEIGRGSSPRPITDQKYFENGNIPWIKIADATASKMYITETKENVNEFGASFSRRLSPGSLILAASGTLGFPMFLGIEGCIHDGWLYFANFNGISPKYLYYNLISLTERFNAFSYGAAIQNINTGIVKNTRSLLPPLQLQKLFTDKINIIHGQIQWLQKKNQNLIKQRDLLLPRLMSGKLEV